MLRVTKIACYNIVYSIRMVFSSKQIWWLFYVCSASQTPTAIPPSTPSTKILFYDKLWLSTSTKVLEKTVKENRHFVSCNHIRRKLDIEYDLETKPRSFEWHARCGIILWKLIQITKPECRSCSSLFSILRLGWPTEFDLRDRQWCFLSRKEKKTREKGLQAETSHCWNLEIPSRKHSHNISRSPTTWTSW